MTDFNDQNNIYSTPNYTPLYNNDNYSSSNYMTPAPPQITLNNITLNKENIPYNESKEYIIYRSPFDCIHALILVISNIIIVMSFIICLSCLLNYFEYFFISIFFPFFGCIFGCCCKIGYYYIFFDSSFQNIIIKEAKIFCCLSKKKIIKINDIQNIILEKNGEVGRIRFKIIFKLADQNMVTLINAFDKNGECFNAFEVIKKVFPKEIVSEGLSTN